MGSMTNLDNNQHSIGTICFYYDIVI